MVVKKKMLPCILLLVLQFLRKRNEPIVLRIRFAQTALPAAALTKIWATSRFVLSMIFS